MSSREELRRAWLLADPADRPLLATRLREARGSDDDHFYGAFAGGGSGGGGGRAAPKSAAQLKSTGKFDPRPQGHLVDFARHKGSKASFINNGGEESRSANSMTIREDYDPAGPAVTYTKHMKRSWQMTAVRTPSSKELVKLGDPLPVMDSDAVKVLDQRWGMGGLSMNEARGSDDDHFYGAYAGGGAGKGGGRAAPASAAQTKSAGLGNAKTKKELRTGDVSKMTAADRAKAHVQDKADAEYRAKNLAIPGQLAAAKEFQFKAKTTAMGGGSYKFQGETFNVSGVHPRGHVQSLRKMAQKAMSSGNDARAKKATDLMLVLNKKFGLGYPVPR